MIRLIHEWIREYDKDIFTTYMELKQEQKQVNELLRQLKNSNYKQLEKEFEWTNGFMSSIDDAQQILDDAKWKFMDAAKKLGKALEQIQEMNDNATYYKSLENENVSE